MRVPCLRCETPFARKRRGPSQHYCQTCRSAIDRIKRRERHARYMERAEVFHAALPEDVGVIDVSDVANYFAAYEGGTHVMDRQPDGWKSPGGSDDGRSTYFTNLAVDLDILCSEAARHPWWSENPHWCVDL